MTEKRFTIFGEWHKDCVIDEIRDNTGEYVTIGRVVDLLNENEQLKKDCTVLIYHNQEYRKENEQLKSTINTLTHDNTKMKKVLNTTKNENEQIKQVIKEAYHNERTHIGRNVLKQLLNNIGETNE